MTFEPEPGTRIHLKNDEIIEFLPLEASGPAAVFVYAESGKEGTVYKVRKEQEQYALKVFYPPYRDKRLLENTDKLDRFKELEGFRVAKRTVVTPENFPDLLNKFPDLTYAVLMPWIEGTVWGNLMTETNPTLHLENYVQIAHALTRVVSHLELQGLAHCDLSNNNFIIAERPAGIQLIDVEDMYAPDMPRPVPDVSYGSIGYRTKWIAEKGLWGPESDRFSMAVLCAEMLTWHDEEIRENKSGNTSFFDEGEIGEESDRYKLMVSHLSHHGDELPALLERAWFSTTFEQCPTVAEWREAVRKLKVQVAPEPSPYMEDQARVATLSIRNRSLASQKQVEAISEPEAPMIEEEPLPTPVANDQATEEILEVAEGLPDGHPRQVSPELEAEYPLEEAVDIVEEPISETGEVVQGLALTESNPDSQQEEVADQLAEQIDDVMQEQAYTESEPGLPAEAVDDEIPLAPVIPEQTEATLPIGLPPKMNIGVEILDFGTVGKAENQQRFSISNSGGAILDVSIQAENWIDLSQRDFALQPGEQQLITAAINTRIPIPRNGLEYRTASALTIESNAGSEVIGARFNLAKPPFYASWWKRALLGAIVGSALGCLLIPIAFLSIYNISTLIVVPLIILLCGIAGLVAYPHRSSVAFLILGWVIVEFLALVLIGLGLGDGAIILGIGAGLGLLGGAIASRIFLAVFRKTDVPKVNW
jgi:serine/threonine protein kinase